MYPRKNESFNDGNQRMESFQNRNPQQPPPRGFIPRRGPSGFDDSFQQSSSNEIPLFRQPPPHPVPPHHHHLIAGDRNNSFPHPNVTPPSHPTDQTSRFGDYDNHSSGWNVPDSTNQQSYNQNIFPPVPPNSLPNISLPPPPLSMYATDTNNQVAPVPPIKTSAIPYNIPQVPFVTPNPTRPPPPILPNAACPPPLPVVLSNQNNFNTTDNSRNQVTSHRQSNMPVAQPAAPPTFIPQFSSSATSDTNLNVGPSIPSQDLLMTFPPPSNFNVPPPNLPSLNNCTAIQQQSFEPFDKELEKDKDEVLDAQRQEDQSWINQRFMRSKNCQPQHPSKKESITISEAQKLIRDMLILAAQFQQQTKNLESIMATASKDDWIKEVQKIESMKEQLQQLQQKVDNEDLMAELEMKVKKRQKKRERLKRSRSRCYLEKQEALARRNERHSQVDEWRDAISQKEIQHKKDKEMKICVDSVLGEVRKKKSDVSKMLEMIKALSKLRKIRKENVAKKGLYTLFHCDQKFEDDISRLQRMLNRQMEVYEAEQRTLMVMLECEQEETKERERAHSHKVQAEIEKREQRREQQLLFGKRTIEDDDPVYPFMKFFSQAEDNWEAFLQIRRDWDNYLVSEKTPGANRIPNSWVMPPEPSDASWAKFLET